MDGITTGGIVLDARTPDCPPDYDPGCLDLTFLRERAESGADNDVTDYASLPDVIFGGAR